MTTNTFPPEVRERAVRMVLEHEAQHPSRWATILSIAAAASGPEPPRLHAKLADVYRNRIPRLREALSAEDGPEIVWAIR
jgi:hypothetical protein